jgi:hypothetical protein
MLFDRKRIQFKGHFGLGRFASRLAKILLCALSKKFIKNYIL